MLNGTKVYVNYDVRNRLKKVNGDIYEYWYDVENNRVDMYASSTNTIYTYDTSDGRNRLVWTIDHNYDETTYYYGAEGLIWSCCEGEYQIYHYDYRGSVVAVTDINGNVTDTLSYDSYGAISSRTGTSKLIFGYNGRDGVLTDPNGLLYMRARYYSPELKRFMNCDILDGSIADSSTLNLYAYVNGNPISFVDPFGLCREEGQEISGVTYDSSFGIHTALDVAGIIPGVGVVADGINILYYLFEGDFTNAAFSAVAFIPIFGDLAGGTKVAAKGLSYSDEAIGLIKNSDEIVEVSSNFVSNSAVKQSFDDLSLKPYAKSRPSFRKGVVEQVWENAKGADGLVRDPNTGEVINWITGQSRKGVWDMGHMPDAKYSEVHKRYMAGEMTTEQFVDWYNDVSNYRPELPSNNRSHRYE